MNVLDPIDFLGSIPIIDVRSPAEFLQGHIPGATNIPIFENEERAEIGTLYKQSGKEIAVERGLAVVSFKMSKFVSDSKLIAKDRKIYVHCWRGGMRSSSFAWLLETASLQPSLLKGGYKNYRNYVLDYLNRLDLKVIILGGFTGSGKTHVLQQLQRFNQQVIDLEGLANHKGSAFGALGQLAQPTNEQFENNLVAELQKLDLSRPIWIEAESRLIGNVTVPFGLWKNIQNGKRINLQVGTDQRVDRIIQEYGQMPTADLIRCINKIESKLGNQNARLAINALKEGNIRDCVFICMQYYDKYYAISSDSWPVQNCINFAITNTKDIEFQSLIYLANSLYGIS